MRKVEFCSIFRTPSQNFKILVIPNILAHGKSYEHGFAKKQTLLKVTRKVEFRLVVCAPSQNFKILAIPNMLDYGKLYELGFVKKRDGHKLYAQSRVKSSFDRQEPSQNFKILAIRNVLTHRNSYEHDFMKKYDSHILCAKSCDTGKGERGLEFGKKRKYPKVEL
ncbi:hypothetical protein BHM03_00020118 [Ensete ventricosum]|nr:hypothetical protein BHM03_00020118 [Ensete ventricosum]